MDQSCELFCALTTVIFSCLIAVLGSKWENEHQQSTLVSAYTVPEDNSRTILFFTRSNGPINGDRKKISTRTSSACFVRYVYVLLTTPQSIGKCIMLFEIRAIWLKFNKLFKLTTTRHQTPNSTVQDPRVGNPRIPLWIPLVIQKAFPWHGVIIAKSRAASNEICSAIGLKMVIQFSLTQYDTI